MQVRRLKVRSYRHSCICNFEQRTHITTGTGYWPRLYRLARRAVLRATPEEDAELYRVFQEHVENLFDDDEEVEDEADGGMEQDSSSEVEGETDENPLRLTFLMAVFLDNLRPEFHDSEHARAALYHLALADWDVAQALANYHEYEMVDDDEDDDEPPVRT